MKIRMLQPLSGDNFELQPGDVTERFDAETAQRLVDWGMAEKVGAGE